MKEYDYIIAGAGCAGLSLAVHMIRSGAFNESRVLLVDKQQARTNDRTWCFWETEAGLFESVVSKTWSKLDFLAPGFSRLLEIAPFSYKLIRGSDFYQYACELIAAMPNFEWCYGNITGISEQTTHAVLHIDGQQYISPYIFSSMQSAGSMLPGEITLQQHFKGLLIETTEAIFDDSRATLMDFTIPQPGETAFMYILPLSSTRALVEYTIFGEKIWPSAAYDRQLGEYISKRLGINGFTVLETELGSIPMSTYRDKIRRGRTIQLGISGGQTKASTGYTFKFIQRHSAALVAGMISKGTPVLNRRNLEGRFHFYDSVLLRVLAADGLMGAGIFARMFSRNSVTLVLLFLENRSTIFQEVRLMMSLQKIPFIRAVLRQFAAIVRQ